MKRNCNLELRLSPSPPSTATAISPHRQQLTIFYDGQISVCDVTELQARAIITEASKQIDQNSINADGSSSGSISPTSPLQSLLCSPSMSGMSMTKSLERFLRKRKHRKLSNSPYNDSR